MTVIVVGGVLERDGKYLLVQEAKEGCRGKWNLPAGRLDPGETILEAAKREIKEESGLSVELSGICQIGNRKRKDVSFVSIIFTTKVVGGDITFDPNEILDVKWFSYDEILVMKEQLRSEVLTIGAIDSVRKKQIAPLGIVCFLD
ncbi:MAG: NUDIX domain-containing protein [Candidatus Saccharibacteria bacterium]|nr:NUDIX domain-containing protein [Candidatus Saccharibacteria bacterium]